MTVAISTLLSGHSMFALLSDHDLSVLYSEQSRHHKHRLHAIASAPIILARRVAGMRCSSKPWIHRSTAVGRVQLLKMCTHFSRTVVGLAVVAMLVSCFLFSLPSWGGEILTIDNGKVVANFADGKKAPLTSSQLLTKNKVRELFDWKDLPSKNSRRLLVTVGESPQQRDLHTPVGGELWQVDSDGAERLVSAGVFQAKLSPDGEKLAYATSWRSVGVQTGFGRLLLDVARGYDPSWKQDGSSIVLSRSAEGSDLNSPGTLSIEVIDIETGGVHKLTDGMFDDARPEFHPSGHWVMFVSGGRTGFASFWRVSANGGDATQITNVGATAVDDRFVPTPFKRTLWSSNGRWFLYDFKLGEKEEVWGLHFGMNGDLQRALKIAVGLDPQWVDNGFSVAVQKTVNGEPTSTIVELPQ